MLFLNLDSGALGILSGAKSRTGSFGAAPG